MPSTLQDTDSGIEHQRLALRHALHPCSKSVCAEYKTQNRIGNDVGQTSKDGAENSLFFEEGILHVRLFH